MSNQEIPSGQDHDEHTIDLSEMTPAEPAAPAEVVPPNYTISDDSWTTTGATFDPNAETVVVPTALPSVAAETLAQAPNTDLRNDAAGKDWALNVGEAFGASYPGRGGEKAASREDAMWQQAVESETGPLRGVIPKFKKTEGQQYTGAAAQQLIRAKMKLGTIFQVPLWHSGFWITLRAPNEASLLELYRKITQEKIDLGRSTYGLMFSNTMVYTHRHLMDFVIEHAYDTSLAVKEMSDLREHIRLPDLSLLIWGLACATWPHGFQYQRPCLSDPEKCHHVVKEKLNLARLLWTDTTKLTPRQIKHMTQRARGKMTEESVKTYVDDFLIGQNKVIKVTDELSVEFKIPFIQEHLDSGHRWVSMIEETYGRAMTMEPESRNAYLLNQSRATLLRQYAHCVASLRLDDQEFSERDVIETALNDLTARDDVRDGFLAAVGEFLDNALVSFIAIPTYKCPACGGEQPVPEGSKYPELIPLDAAQTFFRLLVQRLEKIKNRSLVPTWDAQISG